MIDELDWVRRERPQVDAATPQARRRARQALDEAIGNRGIRRSRRRMTSWLSPGNLAAAGALIVVIAVVAIFLVGHTRKPAAPLAPGGPAVVFRAEPAAEAGRVSQPAVRRAASLLQALVSSSASVTSSGDQVVVRLPRDTSIDQLPRVVSLAAMTGRLAFYDWEANAITSNGETVASRLATRDPEALVISQGSGSSTPGGPGGGSLALYPAVRLAATQPGNASPQVSRPGAEYFAFGKARSSACATAARDYGVPPTTRANTHCYLAGPAPSADQLSAQLPPDVAPAGAQILAVPAGTVVLEAVTMNGVTPSLADPTAQFYVLRDHPGLLGTAITNPATGTDTAGSPDIKFGFTPRGLAAFHALTAGVARRGDLVSSLGETFDQHFAVALGNQLLFVPSIDFKVYPDGVAGRVGVDIPGAFTRGSRHAALLEVRLGALPITLRLHSAG